MFHFYRKVRLLNGSPKNHFIFLNALRIIEEVAGVKIKNKERLDPARRINFLLLDVPWDEALAVILEYQEYGFEIADGIIRPVPGE